MIKERLDECTACPGRLEKKGAYWVCRNCGAVYSIGKHYDGTEFAFPVAPPKDLPCGQMAERAAQISIDKITVKEIKPLQSLESEVYRESVDLDHNEHVKVIKIYLKNGEWETASNMVFKLQDLNDPCSRATAEWYAMACERQAHNDLELVRSFSNITDAEVARLDAFFPYAMPDFRKYILDLLLSSGYVGDEATATILAAVMPYVFNETIYSAEECRQKVDFAFDKVISLGYSQAFDYLLNHTLDSHDVDRYINYLERFAGNCAPAESQAYYERIIAVDPGNTSAHHHLVEADIKANAEAEKCIADFEKLITYSQDPKADVKKFITTLLNEKTTTEAKSNFMWSLLGYYHEDVDAQTQAMYQYANLLLKSQLWAKASDFYSTVLSKDTRNATVYFKLCLADMQATDGDELIAKERTFIDHPYYTKALAIADDAYTKYLEGLAVSRNQRIKTEKARKEKKKKTIIFGAIALAMVLAIIAAVVTIGNVRENRRYSADNIVISILDKVEATFKMKIKNESVLAVLEIHGDMNVYNAEDKRLITTTCRFSGNLASGEEGTFTLNIDSRESEEAVEFYYADFKDLKVTFKITEVIYEGYESKQYEEDAVTILAPEVGSDGLSTTEKSYQEAVALFNQQKYAEAIPLFEALGYYKDSNDYYFESIYNNAISLYAQEKYAEAAEALISISGYKDSDDKIIEIVAAAEAKAETLAATGDYVGALKVLEPLGHNADSSYLYQAYSYASEGKFAEAVQMGLTVAFIPEGVESIPDNYFKAEYQTNQLKKVVLPSSLKSIGTSAFYGCTKLEEINLPAGLQSIGNYAFARCKSLKSVEIPDSVESMGANVFQECTSLQTVSITGSLKTVPVRAFEGCSNLTTVTLKNGIEVLDSNAFSECSSLVSITLPESLVKIESHAFSKCTSLVEITIPANVELIRYCAFFDCTSLQRVHFANQVGWTYEYSGTIIDVADPQVNAKALRPIDSSTWERK